MGDGGGLDVSGVVRLGSGSHSWALRDFTLVVLTAKSEKWKL